MVAAAVLVSAAPYADAQVLPDARVVEWECPLMGSEVQTPPPDPLPGALIADGGFVWYVTRAGQPRLVRFSPGAPLETGIATCNWWDLAPLTVTTGGLRLRPVGSQVFIRTFDDLQRIETTINRLTRWIDGMVSLSDVAVASNAAISVYTTGFTDLGVGTARPGGPASPTLTADDVVQRFTPSSNGSATAIRWEVGGGAGAVYLSGVDVSPTFSNLVYFSQPFDNQIGELNTTTGVVRRWSLTAPTMPPGVFEPRQLDVAFGGEVSLVTGSGHIVRLNPTTNEVFVATIPGDFLNNPFGIDNDGVIGFTAAGGIPGFNKVGMLFPDGSSVIVTPTTETVYSETVAFSASPTTIPQFTGPASPVVKNAPAIETPDTGGTFFEAMIDLAVPVDFGACTGSPADPDSGAPTDPCEPSTQPLGIASDPQGASGSYYAAIGFSVLRLAHVSIPTAAAGMVSGGGAIPITLASTDPLASPDAGKGTFGLVAMRKRVGDPVKGHVTYQNHLTGGKVISLQLTDLVFVDGKNATIGGVCKSGSDCSLTFSVDVTDNGQPSANPRDTFAITRDPILGAGVSEGGTLESGNLKVSKTQ